MCLTGLDWIAMGQPAGSGICTKSNSKSTIKVHFIVAL
jgi:hypothetical protein